KGFDIDLSVGSYRKLFNLNNLMRNHESRKAGDQMSADLVRISVAVADIICAEKFVSFQVFLVGNNNIFNAFKHPDLRFNFSKLDPETPDLYLVVVSSEEFNITIIGPSSKIACSIKSF